MEAKTPLNVKVIQAKAFKSNPEMGTYQMKSNPKGLALIVNYENFPDISCKRNGSEVDVRNLKELCEQLGFVVEIHKDLNKHDTITVLDNSAKNPLICDVDMLMVFVMSHGDNGKITCSDDLYLDIEEILKKFICPGLKGKPKFFVFQACRGQESDFGIDCRLQTDAKPFIPNSHATRDPSWEDMLIVYSTVPGHVSYRHPQNGSWFIQSLVQVFMNHAHDKDLYFMLSRIASELRMKETKFYGEKQSFTYENRHFTKALYFNPGLYENKKQNSEKSWNYESCNVKKVRINKGIYCMQCNNHKIVTGSVDGIITVWDKHTLESVLNLTGHTDTVNCLQLIDGIIISGSKDGTIKTWNAENGDLLNSVHLNAGIVLCLKMNTNNTLITSSMEQRVAVWNYVSPYEIDLQKELIGTEPGVNRIGELVDLNDTYIVYGGSRNRSIKIWSVPSLVLLKALVGHQGQITCLQLRQNLIVSGSKDKTIHIWDVDNGTCIGILEGHGDLIGCIRFDSDRIVSGCKDGKIKVWDLQAALNPNVTNENLCILTLEGHTGLVGGLHLEDHKVVSVAWDYTIQVWNFK